MIKISPLSDNYYPAPFTLKILLQIPTGIGSKKQDMSVILILLIASISVAGLFLAAFLWGVRSGQFEDDYSPASRILFDDKPANKTKTKSP
jgi:cbb3-type cytochrome oxidase maturation protein